MPKNRQIKQRRRHYQRVRITANLFHQFFRLKMYLQHWNSRYGINNVWNLPALQLAETVDHYNNLYMKFSVIILSVLHAILFEEHLLEAEKDKLAFPVSLVPRRNKDGISPCVHKQFVANVDFVRLTHEQDHLDRIV